MVDQNELSARLHKADLLLKTETDTIKVMHRMRINSPVFWAMLFFFFGGIFIIYLSIAKTDSTFEVAIGVPFGFFLTSLAAFGLMTSYFDFVEITATEIIYRLNLKTKTLSHNGMVKFQMKSNKMVVSTKNGYSETRHVKLYVVTNGVEAITFRFQMNEQNGQEAVSIGNKLVQLLNSTMNKHFDQNI